MQNAGLNGSQAGIRIAERNINNLRYADDTTLKGENEKELKSLLINVKEESEKSGLKLNVQKLKMASGPITSWKIRGERVEKITTKSGNRFHFLGLQNNCKVWQTLDSVLKSKDITLLTKACLVKALVSPVVRYGCGVGP